jgi:hypothetical protein
MLNWLPTKYAGVSGSVTKARGSMYAEYRVDVCVGAQT